MTLSRDGKRARPPQRQVLRTSFPMRGHRSPAAYQPPERHILARQHILYELQSRNLFNLLGDTTIRRNTYAAPRFTSYHAISNPSALNPTVRVDTASHEAHTAWQRYGAMHPYRTYVHPTVAPFTSFTQAPRVPTSIQVEEATSTLKVATPLPTPLRSRTTSGPADLLWRIRDGCASGQRSLLQ